MAFKEKQQIKFKQSGEDDQDLSMKDSEKLKTVRIEVEGERLQHWEEETWWRNRRRRKEGEASETQ